jgi:RHS repeat-associated protein
LAALGLLAALGFAALLVGLAKQGAFVLVVQRPGYAGVSAVLVVVLVLGPLPGVPVSRAGGGGGASFYWELADPLGTGMVMLDDTGARRAHRTYSPYGEVQAEAGPASWLLRRYAGHQQDEDSGLVYMQARWMDPQSGTFLSIDPVVGDAGDPQAFNAYAYARNNPASYTDPTGEFYLEQPSWNWFGWLAIVEGGPGDSGPGPSAAPLDSIGNPLAGGLSLGGSSAPQSQSVGVQVADSGPIPPELTFHEQFVEPLMSLLFPRTRMERLADLREKEKDLRGDLEGIDRSIVRTMVGIARPDALLPTALLGRSAKLYFQHVRRRDVVRSLQATRSQIGAFEQELGLPFTPFPPIPESPLGFD